jgi:superfamily II DNA or RNA helicase
LWILTLREKHLASRFRSDESYSITSFYNNCLTASTIYDRAVGFFSSSVFSTCPDAFSAFFKSGGTMRLISSHIFSERDFMSISKGLAEKSELLNQFDSSILVSANFKNKPDHVLSYLVALGQIHIRIAVPSHASNHSQYHEKIGIFFDKLGDFVAFNGSANESKNGLISNFESIEAFKSWDEHGGTRSKQKVADFHQLWENETKNVIVYSFMHALRKSLLSIRNSNGSDLEDSVTSNSGIESTGISKYIQQSEVPFIPPNMILHKHQINAVTKWFENGGVGILEMATGSGKTIAALSAAVKFYDFFSRKRSIILIFVCPYKHLVSQWQEESTKFGFNALICMESVDKWKSILSIELLNVSSGSSKILTIITTNATFSGENFQSFIRSRIPINSVPLFIADEVHNMAGERISKMLPTNISHRLGLSATPDKHNDELGTKIIRDYFGKSVEKYTLKNALEDDVLCPYEYHPILVRLNDQEIDDYFEISYDLSKYARTDGTLDFSNSSVKYLLLKRARLIGTARNKIPALIQLLKDLPQMSYNLIYCGDGSTEEGPTLELQKQLTSVVRRLSDDLGWTVSKYIAETPLTNRDRIKIDFSKGHIDALVAIRCLDEGVDIPEIRRAFILASSTNPRQYIQRRGRILRKSPNKELAYIYDFVVEPPTEGVDRSSRDFKILKNLLSRELSRADEFCSLAVNGPQAFSTFLELRNNYDLLGL